MSPHTKDNNRLRTTPRHRFTEPKPGSEPPGEPHPSPVAERPKTNRDDASAQAQSVQEDLPYRLTLVDLMDDLMELHPGAFEFSLSLSLWDSVRSLILRLLTR